MHPKDLSILDYTYHLPEEKIAKYPLAQRDSSKLLVYKNGVVEETLYSHLGNHLPENTLLVFNNTKVVEARLLFAKPTGGAIEIFCLEPHEQYADITTAMLQKQKVWWKCLVGGAKKWKDGPIIKQVEDIQIQAIVIEKLNDYFLLKISWNDAQLTFAELLHKAGAIPLPPYLNRTAEDNDKETYQTIYAKHDGSVAAPTAGLHFTDDLMAKLYQKNIAQTYVTLHVGAGTFKPVKAEKMEDHEMHSEFIDVSIETIQHLLNHIDKTIVAVGTTSLRTIESLYWMGVKRMTDEGGKGEKIKVKGEDVDGDRDEKIKVEGEDREIENGKWKMENGGDYTIKQQNNQHQTPNTKHFLNQWDAYELPQHVSATDALESLLAWMEQNNMQRIITKTQIIIAPGYKLRIAEGLITNFHQPQSTLLLLIAAIVGNDWKNIYNYALQNNFRFLSYGDGSLLWKQTN
jgi:S-adenosylmethionine:tRNA ribosyltransferase-isomerase